MTPAQVLSWIELHGRKIILRQLPPSRTRLKNRVLMESDAGVVGGHTLAGCVEKSISRKCYQALAIREGKQKEGCE